MILKNYTNGVILSRNDGNILLKYSSYFPEINFLYPYQIDSISKIISGENTLAVVPTGGGKSLIFQLSSLEFEGITLIISPLLALMREQTDELNRRKIKAISLNSEMTFIEQRRFLRNINSEKVKLLYLSPERLQNSLFRASLMASGIKISMIVIDEAHCISQWGHGFRPEYGQIKPFIEFLFKNDHRPVILSLTATISSKPRADILKEFEIDKDNVVISDIMRDNLELKFIKVDDEETKSIELLNFINNEKPKKVLAYLYSQPKCEGYAKEFCNHRFKASFFHAGMDTAEKEKAYQDFYNNNTQIMFSTTAFGMGMNIPDIDAVVHLQLPESIEEYYQHVGRGGRRKDICPTCKCLLLWSDTNIDRKRKQIEKDRFNKEKLENGFKQLGLSKKYPIINKDKEDFYASRENLPLLYFLFEKYGVLNSIGEINGSPQTVELFENTDLWKAIINTTEDIDSFIYASGITGIEVEDIIKHLYEQEFIGNIKKLPAMSKQIFYKASTNNLQNDIADKIVNDINSHVEYRLSQFDELCALFSSKDPLNDIRQKLQIQ